jgi:hypothetical protein
MGDTATDRDETAVSGFRAYIATVGATPLVIALTVFGIFLPVVIVPYAFSDDYPTLWMAVSGEPNPWFGSSILAAHSVGGRPIAGLLSTVFFKVAGTIDNLRFVRLAGIVGIVALALLLQWALVRSKVRPVVAALITVLVCSMPAFEVYASWAVLFVAPLAALLGGGASMLASSIVDSPLRLVRDRFIGAVCMLVAALLIYQPPAMFFWVFLAIALIGTVQEPSRAGRVVRRHAEVAVVALPLALLIGKVAAHLAHNNSPNAARSQLTLDVIGKARWFFAHPLYRSLNLFELTASPWLAAFVVAVAAGGIVAWLVLRTTRPLFNLVIAVALVPLSFLPNLVVKENNSLVFRTGIALTSLVALYFCLGALAIFMLCRDWLRTRVSVRALAVVQRSAVAISGVCVALVAGLAARNVMTLVVDPQSTELRIMRSDIAAIPAGSRRIGFVQTAWNQGLTNWYSDELGLASSARPWTAEPATMLILREEGRLPPGQTPPAVDLYPWTAKTFPQGEPVIDLRGLQNLR